MTVVDDLRLDERSERARVGFGRNRTKLKNSNEINPAVRNTTLKDLRRKEGEEEEEDVCKWVETRERRRRHRAAGGFKGGRGLLNFRNSTFATRFLPSLKGHLHNGARCCIGSFGGGGGSI